MNDQDETLAASLANYLNAAIAVIGPVCNSAPDLNQSFAPMIGKVA